ncbi:MAG: hypothetical protein OXP12_06445 [Thaumarchaeota archaeon]|nr:hypothetical protein [Nitrososphaerota archaeon]MDE0266156.1 hypothetical protein [Nitrososphaerota archaeon]
MKTAGAGTTKKAQTARTVCTEASGGSPEYFVGIDLHKKFMQMALMDSGGNVLLNKRIECDFKKIPKEFASLPVVFFQTRLMGVYIV